MKYFLPLWTKLNCLTNLKARKTKPKIVHTLPSFRQVTFSFCLHNFLIPCWVYYTLSPFLLGKETFDENGNAKHSFLLLLIDYSKLPSSLKGLLFKEFFNDGYRKRERSKEDNIVLRNDGFRLPIDINYMCNDIRCRTTFWCYSRWHH